MLLLLSVTTALAISGTFHHCYVMDSLRPDPRDNTPPSVKYESVYPPIYKTVDIEEYAAEGLLEFTIPDIYDPDPESRMYGRWAVDYLGGTAQLNTILVNRKIQDGEELDSWWEASFKIPVEDYLGVEGIHIVIAAFSDRDWDEASGEYFAVPEDTMPVFVIWTVEVPTGPQ